MAPRPHPQPWHGEPHSSLPLGSLPLLNYTHCPSVFCEILAHCPLKEFVKLCIITIFTPSSFLFLIKQTGTIKKYGSAKNTSEG